MVVIDTHLARGASNGGFTFHDRGGPYGRTKGAKRVVAVDVTGLPVGALVVPASTHENGTTELIYTARPTHPSAAPGPHQRDHSECDDPRPARHGHRLGTTGSYGPRSAGQGSRPLRRQSSTAATHAICGILVRGKRHVRTAAAHAMCGRMGALADVHGDEREDGEPGGECDGTEAAGVAFVGFGQHFFDDDAGECAPRDGEDGQSEELGCVA